MNTLWRRWRALGRKAGDFQARIFLTLFYFTLAAPFGLGARWLGDALRLRQTRGTPEWRVREHRTPDLSTLRDQA